jgi:serine/threonine protein phosphatase PrpC
MAIMSSGSTDIGMKRSTNQDSICMHPQKSFFAVADGMGGHNGGDIASQMSVKLMPEFLDRAEIEDPAELLIQSIKYVNKTIYQHGQENEELRGMGTTVTAVMISGSEMHIANVGDSRAYLINKRKLYQVSRDHSLVQEKLNIGIYDRDQAKADPQKNVLIRTVGFEPNVDVDTYKYKIQKNDIFLLCSDGLHGKVSDEDIIHLVNQYIPEPSTAVQSQLDKLVEELIRQANINGGQDNISVIITLTK